MLTLRKMAHYAWGHIILGLFGYRLLDARYDCCNRTRLFLCADGFEEISMSTVRALVSRYGHAKCGYAIRIVMDPTGKGYIPDDRSARRGPMTYTQYDTFWWKARE